MRITSTSLIVAEHGIQVPLYEQYRCCSRIDSDHCKLTSIDYVIEKSWEMHPFDWQTLDSYCAALRRPPQYLHL